MDKTVLIVEDERAIVEILKFNLEREGYKTLEALDGETGLALARSGDPDLILLDVMLPKMNGFDICAALRRDGSAVPIIMLTAREEETDKVFGLELGADDYITKPFSMREVVARVRTNMRRAAAQTPPEDDAGGDSITVRELTLRLDRHALYKNGRELELTQREYELIKFLMQNPGKVVSRQELMTEVWQYDYYGDLRAVDVAVRRLREKLEDNPAEPAYVITKRGAGYYFAG